MSLLPLIIINCSRTNLKWFSIFEEIIHSEGVQIILAPFKHLKYFPFSEIRTFPEAFIVLVWELKAWGGQSKDWFLAGVLVSFLGPTIRLFLPEGFPGPSSFKENDKAQEDSKQGWWLKLVKSTFFFFSVKWVIPNGNGRNARMWVEWTIHFLSEMGYLVPAMCWCKQGVHSRPPTWFFQPSYRKVEEGSFQSLW